MRLSASIRGAYHLPQNAGANRGPTTPVQPGDSDADPVCVTPCPIAVRGLGRGTLLAGTIGGQSGVPTTVQPVPSHLILATSGADQTPVFLTFIGALVLALVAAGTAQWRQRVQLRHDREIRDLEELRSLLDECARMAGTTNQLLLFMLNRSRSLPRTSSPVDGAARGRPLLLRELGVSIDVVDDDYSSKDSDYRALEDAFYKAAAPVFGLYQRIVMRLGETHEISRAYLELQFQWVALGISALLAETDPDSAERDAGIEMIKSEARTAQFSFLHASRLKIGSSVRNQGGLADASSYAVEPEEALPPNSPLLG